MLCMVYMKIQTNKMRRISCDVLVTQIDAGSRSPSSSPVTDGGRVGFRQASSEVVFL